VSTLLQSVPRLEGGRFEFFLFPRYSCARYFSLGANRIAGATSPEPEHQPDRTATVAKPLYCFSRRGDVSTMIPTPSRTSRTYWFTLYRIVVPGPRGPTRPSAICAVEVERERESVRGW
jgi:hypothetical protein